MPATSTSTTGTVIGEAGRTTSTADRATDRRQAMAELAEIVCADPDWVQREFAELIEATYPPAAAAPARVDRPRWTGVATHTARRPPRWPGPRSKPAAFRARPPRRCPSRAAEPARQRSPPNGRAR